MLVYIVVRAATARSRLRDAQSAVFSSGWAVMSFSVTTVLRVLDQHVAVGSDQQRPERHVPRGARLGGELDRPTEVVFIRLGHR